MDTKLQGFFDKIYQEMEKGTESSLFYVANNIGYDEWTKHENWSYGDMLKYVSKNYGDLGELLLLLGSMNGQVCNGGFIQWFDNGYLNSTGGGVFRNKSKDDYENLDKLISLLKESELMSLPHANQVLNLLYEMDGILENSSGECEACNGHRYVPCETCHGEGTEECPSCGGSGEDEDGETCSECNGDCETSCYDCDGNGEVPCEECNYGGQLGSDEDGPALDNDRLEQMDSKYYSFNEEWIKEIHNFLSSSKLQESTPDSPSQLSDSENEVIRLAHDIYNEELSLGSNKEEALDSALSYIDCVCWDKLAMSPDKAMAEFRRLFKGPIKEAKEKLLREAVHKEQEIMLCDKCIQSIKSRGTEVKVSSSQTNKASVLNKKTGKYESICNWCGDLFEEDEVHLCSF